MAKLRSGFTHPPAVSSSVQPQAGRMGICPAMSARSVTVVLGLVTIFIGLFASRPLWHTDLWDHVNYGQFILQSGVPETEPLLELTENTPFVSTAWLSQVGMATLAGTSALGLPGLQFIHGLLVVIGCTGVGLIVFRRNCSSIFTVIAYCIFVAVNWQQLIVIRPQLVGVACYCLTFAALHTGLANHRMGKIWLGFLFLFWANCHGSFSMGLVLIALTTAGQFFDAAIRARNIFASLRTRRWTATALAMVVCVSVVTINPFGIRIYAEVLRVGRHPNIATMYEWDPMTLQMKQGQAMAVATIVLIALMAWTPRRLRLQEILPLLVTGGLAIWSARMVNWYAPLAAGSIGIHGAAVYHRFSHRSAAENPPRRKLWTAVNGGLLIAAFVCSSLGIQTFFGNSENPETFLSPQTPVDVTQFLATADDLPPGLTLAPAEWAGYIMHHAGDRVKPFANLHVHVIPPHIWQEYIKLIIGTAGWNERLQLYDINTVIVDKLRYPLLAKLAIRNGTYDCVFDDQQASVFVRRPATTPDR